jgi:FAD/FMN-containing dehydrogenase
MNDNPAGALFDPIPAAALQRLAGKVSGCVVTPASSDYNTARRIFNARIDRQPGAIVYAESAHDVQATVEFTRSIGRRLSVRSGGCSVAGFSVNTSGVVLDVSRLNQVTVHEDGRATFGAGVQLAQVYDQLLSKGQVIPGGECPNVGISGLTLGGGMSLLGRKLGITLDSLIGASITLADGRHIRVSEEHHPGLFWALRGAGGGNFGVVTELEFATSAMTHDVYAGSVTWPLDQAQDALQNSLEIFAGDTLPDEFDAIYMILNANGQKALWMVPVFWGTQAEGDPILERFTCVGKPAVQMQMWDYAKYLGSHFHAPKQKTFAYWKSGYVTNVPSAPALRDLIEGFASCPSDEALIAFEMCGGAMNRVPMDATAFPHRNHLTLLSILANSSGKTPDIKRWALDLYSQLVEHEVFQGHHYANYPDRQLEHWAYSYWGSNFPRLQRIKQRWDPDHFFKFRQGVYPPEPAP